MAELFERDGHCERCGCPIYTDPMMGTHCACPPWEPKPAAPADGHAWTFDPYHGTQRCTACGEVSYAVPLPMGPCTCAPSKWLPPGADDAPPRPVISNDGRCSCGSKLVLAGRLARRLPPGITMESTRLAENDELTAIYEPRGEP